MKKKLSIIAGAVIALILVIVLIITLVPKTTQTPETSTDVPSSNETVPDVPVEVEDIHTTESASLDSGSFIEPDESEADKILEENKKENESKVESKPQSSTTQKPTTQNEETQTFDESTKEVEQTAQEYLKANKIDPKTAGETGERCAHCGKKIWNPDKYGLCIPGMPDNYENSGYCLGTCGITLG